MVGRGREAELAGIVFEAALELCVVSEGDERAVEKSSVHNGVTHAKIEERREISEGVVEMVRHIPSCMTGAEALLRVAGGSGKTQCRTEAHGPVREIQAEVREERAHANSGDCTGIILLDGRSRARKIKRHAHINAKVAGKNLIQKGGTKADKDTAPVTTFRMPSPPQSHSNSSC